MLFIYGFSGQLDPASIRRGLKPNPGDARRVHCTLLVFAVSHFFLNSTSKSSMSSSRAVAFCLLKLSFLRTFSFYVFFTLYLSV